MGINSEKVAEGLNGDDGARNGIFFRDSLLKEDLQRFPCAAAQIGKKTAIVEKIPDSIFGMLKTKCR